MKSISNLDLLRATAVLFVVLDHTLKFHGLVRFGPIDIVALGGIGVDFFFVHTCLVLMMSLERLQSRFRGARLWLAFYARRVFRIYPLSIAFVALVVLLSIPAKKISLGLVHYAPTTARELISNLLLIQNLTFEGDVIGVLWSLPLEVQMYLCLPLLFGLIPRFRSKWSLLGFWLIGGVLGWLLPHISARATVARYFTCFFPGVIAYRVYGLVQPRLPGWTWPIWVLSLGAIVSIAANQWTESVMCLILGFSIPQFKGISSEVLKRGSAWIAQYSYGIYLCHVPAIWFAFQYMSWQPGIVQWLIYLLVLVVIPVAVFHAIEQPGIRIGSKLTDRWSSAEEFSAQSSAKALEFEPEEPVKTEAAAAS